jgi:predicted nuclease of predicted toxin-antitoxin system
MKLKSCSFLADENIQPSVIQFLRQLNFDVISVLGEDLIGHSDEEITLKAFLTKRVVLTQDQDFGEILHTTDSRFIGIIYLRPGHVTPDYHIETLKKLFEENPEVIPPFIVIGSNISNIIRIRIRNQVL